MRRPFDLRRPPHGAAWGWMGDLRRSRRTRQRLDDRQAWRIYLELRDRYGDDDDDPPRGWIPT